MERAGVDMSDTQASRCGSSKSNVLLSRLIDIESVLSSDDRRSDVVVGDRTSPCELIDSRELKFGVT
jgi:hypothetical protein